MIETFLLSAAAGVAVKAHRRRREGNPRSACASRRRRPWTLPPPSLLATPGKPAQGNLGATGASLVATLAARGVDVELVDVIAGPTVVRYEIALGDVRVSRLTALRQDMAYALGTQDVRIQTPVSGRSVVGVEVPRRDRGTVALGEVLAACQRPLDFAVGTSVDGHTIVGNLGSLPHLLVAGATGSGKSMFINSLILSVLMTMTPSDVRFVMVDPKRVELSPYAGIPHLGEKKRQRNVVTETADAVNVLAALCADMDKRYAMFQKMGVRNIDAARAKGVHLPYVILVIDELADLMMACGKDVETYLARFTQLGRAAGMHGVLATQRPSVDVVTGIIKANVPARAGFAVATATDSRVILDQTGAEVLSGKGDMLWSDGGSERVRVQGVLTTDDEIERIAQWWKKQK